MNHHHLPDFSLAMPFLLAMIGYVVGFVQSIRQGKQWPVSRLLFWMVGAVCGIVSVYGPLAERAHHDFSIHMLGHLLLGMLGPLLMALGLPVKLLLRASSVDVARTLTRMFKSRFFGVVTHPVVAAILNIGGLWLLYRTELFSLMHHDPALYAVIHLHVFLAGYAFTASILAVDQVFHYYSHLYRTIVFVVALAGHGILSKVIYASPPAFVPEAEAQTGAMLMYYGGDAVDLILIFLLFHQWYVAAQPRTRVSVTQ